MAYHIPISTIPPPDHANSNPDNSTLPVPSRRPIAPRCQLPNALEHHCNSPGAACVAHGFWRFDNHLRSKSLPLDWTDEPIMAESFHPSDRALSHPPSSEEICRYYNGLPSNPKLVARTSIEPWKINYVQSYQVLKTLDPVGKHPIVPLWNDSQGPLRQSILEAVDHVQWTALDFLRLGYERIEDDSGILLQNPVTLLVSVEPTSTSWSVGLSLALKCRDILRQHFIHDIEVEVKESVITRTASLSHAPVTALKLSSTTVYESLPESSRWAAFLSESLGVSVASLQTPFREGTKGLYLRRRDTQSILLLTCRHMVFDKSDENETYQHKEQAPWPVIQPGNATLSQAIRETTAEIHDHETSMANWLLGPRPVTEVAAREAKRSALEGLRHDLEALQDPASRIIGHVLFSPKYGVGTSPSGARRYRDWALIELHQGKHETELHELRNKIMAGYGAGSIVRRARLSEFSDDDYKRAPCTLQLESATNILCLDGIMSEDEMRAPEFASVSLDKPAIIVGKYGLKTQLTIGVANEVKSVCREPILGQYYQSEEWCIVGAKHRSERRCPFSEKGDSGSCVWDMQGRACALLTAGIGAGQDGPDVSYATPMEWLIDDIRAHGFDVEMV